MPAPKHPNTGPATEGKIRKAQERKAQALREAGWTCIPPEDAEVLHSASPKVDEGGKPDD